MKKIFWKLMFLITLISLLFTFIFGSEIPWGNLESAYFSWPLAKKILYDISVGVFSSMILVWCIDRIQLRETEKQESKQRLILYNKLTPFLTDYYNFYLFLYIATRSIPVEPDNKVLYSLYECKDEFIKQLKSENPFYKDGYYGDPSKYKKQIALMEQHANNNEVIDEVLQMSTNLPWYVCWEIEGAKFYDGISQIEKDFPTFFTNDLLEIFDKLLEKVYPQKNMVNFVEGKHLSEYFGKRINYGKIPTEMFIDTYEIEEILRLLDSIMNNIEIDSSKNLKARDLKFFNDRNVCPQIGYSCEKENTDN